MTTQNEYIVKKLPVTDILSIKERIKIFKTMKNKKNKKNKNIGF